MPTPLYETAARFAESEERLQAIRDRIARAEDSLVLERQRLHEAEVALEESRVSLLAATERETR